MEQILKQILEKLNSMETDIKELKAGQAKLEQGQQEIKSVLKFMWDDIKKLDNRLSQQEDEVFTLKRVK